MSNDMTTVQQQQTSLAPTNANNAGLDIFCSMEAFANAQRMARMFASSSMVPKDYKGDENLGNCVIALDMAARLRANPLMVMQNLQVVEGRPTWSSQFLIATFNQCGRFSPIRYDMSEYGEPQTVEWTEYEWQNTGGRNRKVPISRKTDGFRDRTCVAYATDLATDEVVRGPEISLIIAVKERWYFRNGSKWQTMPELMLRYRAASMMVKQTAPELSMGIPTTEETRDIIDVTPDDGPRQGSDAQTASQSGGIASLTQAAHGQNSAAPADAEQGAAGQADQHDQQGPEWPKANDDGELVDARGVIFIAGIHSQGKVCNQDGSWRRARGVSDQQMAAAEAADAEALAMKTPEPEGESNQEPMFSFEEIKDGMERAVAESDEDAKDEWLDIARESLGGDDLTLIKEIHDGEAGR